jgi:hypothetical protein
MPSFGEACVDMGVAASGISGGTTFNIIYRPMNHPPTMSTRASPTMPKTFFTDLDDDFEGDGTLYIVGVSISALEIGLPVLGQNCASSGCVSPQ